MALELWTAGVGIPGFSVRQAQRAEEEGWDGIGFVDSQNLAADPFVELVLAAQATTTLRLATAVTNPVTRHPAAMATVAATVQAESGGRMVLGIGRGDSSLAHIGLAPAPVGVFDRYLDRLQGYLRGDDVAFAVETDGGGELRGSATLGMAGGPTSSRMHWLRDIPKVPVDVAASGPMVIAAGARRAERVTLAVGADPARVGWGIGEARRARADVVVGAYVPVVVHDDRDAARRLIAGGVASFARFSVMHGQPTGPVSEDQRQVLTAVHGAYDMNAHFRHGSPQSAVLTDDVIDAFGIAGPAGYCIERLGELVSLGLTKLYLLGPGFGADADAVRASRSQLVDTVLPALRG
ncbi:MAG: LLM class flavin-dependent oxidoreductase [Acidimicrobiales bacterium]